MMTNHITNTSLSYQIDLPSLWNFPACWLSLCEEIVEDLDMACGYGNSLTLGCCTSWHQLAPAGPSWSKVGQATHQNTDGELCAKKYIRPHTQDENELAAPLTEEELARVREVFPDLQTTPVQPRPLSPVLQEMSDPHGLGATPTHEADTQALDHEPWEAEGVLRVPPHVGGATATIAEEGQHTVERGAVCTSRAQEKRREGSPGSTAPPSTAATRGPWSCTTSLRDWYPDEHPFIKNYRDTDDPNETPYALTT